MEGRPFANVPWQAVHIMVKGTVLAALVVVVADKARSCKVAAVFGLGITIVGGVASASVDAWLARLQFEPESVWALPYDFVGTLSGDLLLPYCLASAGFGILAGMRCASHSLGSVGEAMTVGAGALLATIVLHKMASGSHTLAHSLGVAFVPAFATAVLLTWLCPRVANEAT